MTNEKRQSNHDWCPPPTETPADQPNPPECKDCDPLPTKDPPKLDKPDECPKPDCDCKCPPKKTQLPTCIEKASTKQAAIIAAGDKAKAVKTDLDAFQAKAKAAQLDYTRDKYKLLVAKWEQEDRDIADLIRRLVCAVPCWECIVQCYVCPLIDELHNLEKWLHGTNALYGTVDNLYDLQYWRARDKTIKEDRFNRIKAVLAAWEKPAQTIEKILNDNQTLIDNANKNLGTAPGPLIYDVFLRLVPMHLAVAPPRTSDKTTTRIDQKYTDLCGCDKGWPDVCCGPDVGPPSLLDRVIGPQPYLIDPDSYFKLICCLVEKRYEPANDALNQALADQAAVDEQITKIKNQIGNGYQIGTSLQSLERDAKASIPSVVDCCDYEKDEETTSSSSPSSYRAR